MKTVDEITIERFNDALSACGSSAYLQNGLTMCSLGHLVLKHESCEIRVDLRRDSLQPDAYIDLADMQTRNGMSGNGQGRIALMKLFDIADTAGIEMVRVGAVNTGVYAHATHYARCDESSWKALQRALLMNLACYADTSIIADRSERLKQASAAKPLIEQSNGQLGKLVDRLRIPTIGLRDARYPTLAKYLFLNDSFPRSYVAHWTSVERKVARDAYGWITPTPLLKPSLAAPDYRPQTRTNRLSRLARAILG